MDAVLHPPRLKPLVFVNALFGLGGKDQAQGVRDVHRLVGSHPPKGNAGGRKSGMEQASRCEVAVERVMGGVGVFHPTLQVVGSQKGPPLRHAGRKFVGCQLVPRSRAISLLLNVVSLFVNARQNQTRCIGSGIGTDRSVPPIIVPGHAQGNVADWQLSGF